MIWFWLSIVILCDIVLEIEWCKVLMFLID